MANLCEKLLANCIGADCDAMPVTGMDSNAWIFNKSQIASITYDENNPNLATAITMKTHEVNSSDVAYTGFKINQLGKVPFTGTQTAFNANDTFNNFTETLQFIYYDNSPSAAMSIDQIANGRFLVVVKNEFEGADGKGTYQIYGAGKALVASEISRDPYSDENIGAWVIQLQAENTSKSAVFIEHTDTSGSDPVVDTESYLDSLVDCD